MIKLGKYGEMSGVMLTGFTGGLRRLSCSIDLSNPRWNDWAYGELSSS